MKVAGGQLWDFDEQSSTDRGTHEELRQDGLEPGVGAARGAVGLTGSSDVHLQEVMGAGH